MPRIDALSRDVEDRELAPFGIRLLAELDAHLGRRLHEPCVGRGGRPDVVRMRLGDAAEQGGAAEDEEREPRDDAH